MWQVALVSGNPVGLLTGSGSSGCEGTTAMTQQSSRQKTKTGPAAHVESPGVVEEIEVRGHIVDSLLLPKILDRILLMGGSFEIRECKIGVRRVRPELRPNRDPGRRPGDAGRNPGRSGRARCLADPSGGCHDGHGGYRGCVS